MNPQSDHKIINYFLYRIDESDTFILALSLLLPFITNYQGSVEYFRTNFLVNAQAYILVIIAIFWLFLVIRNALIKKIPTEGEKYHVAVTYFIIVAFMSVMVIIPGHKDIYAFFGGLKFDNALDSINSVFAAFFLIKSLVTLAVVRSIDDYSVLITEKYEETQMTFLKFWLILFTVIGLFAVLNTRYELIYSVYFTFVYASSIFMLFKKGFKLK